MRNLGQTFTCCACIAVSHLPETAWAIAQGRSHIRKTVDLVRRRLANLTIYGNKIIPVDRSRSRCPGACGPLCPVMLVDPYPFLGGHMRGDHFKEIELRSNLEKGIFVRPVFMEFLHVRHNLPHCRFRSPTAQ